MYTIEVVDRATKKLLTLPQELRARVRARLTRNGQLLLSLMRGKVSGIVLNKRSGRLFRSLRVQMHENADMIWLEAGSFGDVPYAGIHERGGKTRPHLIVPKNARALHFYGAAGEQFATKVNHPGSKIPRRSYVASSLREVRGRLLREAHGDARGLW